MTEGGDAPGERVTYTCGHCHTKVQTQILGSVHDKVESHEPPVAWVLVKCGGCERPNVVGREYYGSYHDVDQWGDWRIYPPSDRAFGPEVPEAIRRAFYEAQVDLRVGSYLSTALMCRRAVELLSSDLGAPDDALAKKLSVLRDRGVIDARLYEWADALRLAGNGAAHDNDPDLELTRTDAEDLAAFTEALIDYVYIYRARFEEFRERREGAAGQP